MEMHLLPVDAAAMLQIKSAKASQRQPMSFRVTIVNRLSSVLEDVVGISLFEAIFYVGVPQRTICSCPRLECDDG